jgi:hypothetical protein
MSMGNRNLSSKRDRNPLESRIESELSVSFRPQAVILLLLGDLTPSWNPLTVIRFGTIFRPRKSS